MERLNHSIANMVSEGSWAPIRLTRSGTPISHLFFADDVILFSKANVRNAEAIRDTLEQFSWYSGHRVSVSKTRIFFSPNTSVDTAISVGNILGYQRVENLGKYLGIPILHGRVSARDYQYVVDKVRKRLSGWNAKSLSMAGRVTLAKSVLATIPNYCMQVVMIPVSTINEIVRLIRQFIWGGSNEKRKIPLVDWKSVCQPINCGGLGIRDLKTHNMAFMVKFGFRLVADETSLWARILREKYKMITSCPETNSRKGSSFLWRSLSKVWHHVYDGISWSIGNGERTRFWSDVWIPELGPLIGHKVDNFVVETGKLVCEMADGAGSWLWDEFRHQITDEAATKMASINAPMPDAGRDLCMWRWADNGKFTVSAAYEALCKHQWEAEDDKWVAVWSYRGPQRVRQFLWLVVKQRILTNVERCRRYVADNASCSFCGYDQEHIDHALRSCPAAVAVWSKVIAPSQWTRFLSLPFDAWIMDNMSSNRIANGYSWSTFFGILCWRIWKNRNMKVFNDKSSSAITSVVQCQAWSRAVMKNENKRKIVAAKAWKKVGWKPPSAGHWTGR